MPPFVGTHSETWERFGISQIPSGTSILGGIATISGDELVTFTSFMMCLVHGMPSDGTILMYSDRPTGPLTVSFSQPVSAFGAYWGSGVGCFGDPPSILTFRDVAGNVIGTDSFVYTGDGTLAWHGYQFGTPVATITRIAGDGQEGVAIDGLQATVARTTGLTESDFNSDGHPDYLLSKSSTGGTVIWYLDNNVHTASATGPTVPLGWKVVGVADFNGNGHPDYLLFNSATGATVVWYLNNYVHTASATGPTVPLGWSVVGVADFNGNGHPDYLLFNSATGATVIWYLNNYVHTASTAGPTVPFGWSVVGIADFNASGRPDYLLFNSATGATVIWYLNNNIHTGSTTGPTAPLGWGVVGTADFNGDGHPDYLLFNSATGATVIWYLNNNVRIASAPGPTLPASWNVAAP